jgi:hypothetical protein
MKGCGRRLKSRASFASHVKYQHGEELLSDDNNKYIHKINHIRLLGKLLKQTIEEITLNMMIDSPSVFLYNMGLITEVSNMIIRKSTKSKKQIKGMFEKYFLKA